MTDPTFSPVVMQEMLDEGVLMAANEAFFWPLGLALTWTVEDGRYLGDMHIREWRWADGHHERIVLGKGDEVGVERRVRFAAWREARMGGLEELP
jgi:hypothetical protein